MRGLSLLLLTISFVLMSAGTLLRAQEYRYAGASMELGVNARALALGGSAVALTGDGASFYYNPASISFTPGIEVALMYAPTFGSLTDPMAQYHHAGVVVPLVGGGTVAVNWTRFLVDDIPVFSELRGGSFADRFQNPALRPDGTPDGVFQDVEDVVYFSFSKLWTADIPLGWLFIDLPIQWPMGVNVKVIRQSLHTSTASGLGLDIGTQFKFSLGRLLGRRFLGDVVLGYSGLDITKTTVVWSTRHEDRIRPTHRLGAAYSHRIPWQESRLQFFWTLYKKYDRHHLLGLEWSARRFALRFGHNGNGLTGGVGLRVWKVDVDYAFVTLELDQTHRISCRIHLSSKDKGSD
jgi:hypothetical protein